MCIFYIMPESVIDKIGEEIWYDIITHDDGVANIGGSTVGIIGTMGAGKTTVVKEVCKQSKYCFDKSNKSGPFNTEGIIYVGRSLDTWLNLFDIGKPIKIFDYAPTNSYYCISKGKTLVSINTKLSPIMYHYTSILSVIDNLLLDGINIIYAPPSYTITENILSILQKRIGQKPPDVGTACDPALWWFDFINHLVKTKAADEFYTIVCDEAHRLFPPSPSGAWWHLIQDLCESLVDLRKSNLSFVLATHDTNLIDYRITDRLNFFCWMRGSSPPTRISQVYPSLSGRCNRGQAILEEKGVRFGRGYTMKNRNTQPHIRVFNESIDKEILKKLIFRDTRIGAES